MLPTPDRYARRRPAAVRASTGACPLCTGGDAGDTDHSLECITVAGTRRGVQAVLDDELSRFGVHPAGEVYGEPPQIPSTCLYWYTDGRYGGDSVDVRDGVSTHIAEALQQQHEFNRTCGMLGAQPKYIQRALHHFLPGFNERQLNRLRVRLRKLALDGAMHVYKKYLRGMCRWARDEGHARSHHAILNSMSAGSANVRGASRDQRGGDDTGGSALSEELMKAWKIADTDWIGLRLSVT
jgi:hypothetical protein